MKIDTLTVATRTNPTAATGVTSNVVLDAGVNYLAGASGTARIANDATGFTDAEFIRYNRAGGPQDGSSPGYAWNNHGVRLSGVSGGDTGGNFWGGYQPDHVYPVLVAGQGTKVTGYYSDIPGYYGDNSGTLQVDLYAEVPTVSVAWAADATEGGLSGEFRFTRTGDLSRPLTVYYSPDEVADNAATPGIDYAELDGTVTFEPASATASLFVTALEDAEPESPEGVTIWIASDPAYSITGYGIATLDVVDSTPPSPDLPEVSVTSTGTATEGGADGAFRFSRTGDVSQSLTVAYQVGGTAQAGDVQGLGGLVTFDAGRSTARVTVGAIDDTEVEATEAVELTVLPGIAYNRGTAASATLPVADNDKPLPADLVITSVNWVNNTNERLGNIPLDANPNAGGGLRIFAEKAAPTDWTARRFLNVEVQLSSKIEKVPVYLRMYDVDDPSSNQAPVDDEKLKADNRTGRDVAKIVDATDRDIPVAFTNKDGVAFFPLLQVSTQPGNNYRVAASIHPGGAGLLGTYARQNDGDKARLEDANGVVRPTTGEKLVASPMLTVWRHLHVERDHMDKPRMGELFSDSNPPPMNGEQGYDDINPNGPIPDAGIDLMVSSYRPAYIEVVDDLQSLNLKTVIPFVHNIGVESVQPLANLFRDVPSTGHFWVLQIASMYELNEGLDNDPIPGNDNPPNAILGLTPGGKVDPLKATRGPNAIFTETIRDVAATNRNLQVGFEEAVLRIVLHESLHSFNLVHGTPPGDEGPLSATLLFDRERTAADLTPALLDWVRSTKLTQ